MAKPDTDDGWLPYAHELDAALAVADFSKGARIVLREVFSQCFGLARNRTAILSPSEIGGRVGVMKEHIVKAVGMLVACGVLTRVSRGEYRFVKDYERWTFPDGSARLTKTEIAWCLSAPYVAKAHLKSRKPVLNTGAQLVPLDSRLGAQLVPGDDELGSAVGSRLGAQLVPEIPPPYRNGRGIEEREIERIQASLAGGHGERNGNNLVSPIEDLIAQAGSIFNAKIAAVVQSNAGDIIEKLGDRLDCYLAALQQASRAKCKIRDLHAFCMSEARKYLRTGIPPKPVSVEPHSSPATSKSKIQDDSITRAMALLADPEDV
jgi:hypothetical protein